jgi:hypothetical protein
MNRYLVTLDHGVNRLPRVGEVVELKPTDE